MKNRMDLRNLILASLITALTCVLSYVAIPVPWLPVPITGQTFGVMFAGSILKPKYAALSMVTYLLLGFVGMPVFSKGASGISYIATPGGGFLIGFLIGAVVISLLRNTHTNSTYRNMLLPVYNIIGGIIIIYSVGVPWMSLVGNINFNSALMGSILYIPGDIIKVIVTTIVAVPINLQLKRYQSV